MSTTIGNLAVILSANAAGFSAGMAAAQKTAGTFMATMGSMAKTAGTLVGIASAASLVTAAFKGFTGAEESLITFQALLGSAGAAKKFKEELKDFGDMSPFGDGVGTAAKTLLKFNFAQEEVLPTLKMLGDVAAGVNVPLEDLAAIVGENGYRANITTKQLIAMGHMGIPIMQELTKTTGMSQAAILEVAGQGGLKFEHLAGAFRSATSEGGNFFGMMDLRANTTKNLMARIVDQTGDVVGKLGSVLGNRISSMFGVKGGMNAIFDWLQKAEDGVKKMGPWFDNVILVFQTLGDVANSVWNGIATGFNYGWGIIKAALDKTGLNVQTFRDFFVDSMLSVRFVFQNFGDLVNSILGRTILKIWGFGEDVAFVFTDTIPTAMKWFANNWRGIWDNIAAYMKFKLAEMAQWAQRAGGQFDLGLATILENVGLAPEGHARRHFDKMVADQKGQVPPEPPVFQNIPRPVFGERVAGAAEAGFKDNLDKLDQKLGDAKKKFFDAELPKFMADPNKDLGVGGNKSRPFDFNMGTKATDLKRAGAFEAGSKEAYNVMIRSRDIGKAPAERAARAGEQTAKNTGKMAADLGKIAANDGAIAVGSLDLGNT